MTVYITNAAFARIERRIDKFVVIHYFEDCELMNATFTSGMIERINSGIKFLHFETKEDFLAFMSMYDCGYDVCGMCDTKELISMDTETKYKKSKTFFLGRRAFS